MKLKVPKISLRNPFKNPIGLKKLHQKFFGKKSRRFSWKQAGIVALWGAGIFVLIAIFLFAWFAKDLPTPNKIRDLVSVGSTRLYDRNMKPLYTISGDKKRILIENKDIPEVAKQATIALEDRDFYKHVGLDFTGILRAVFVDIARRDLSQGGSTLTQQLAKNAILTREKSFVRKIKEAILAIEMEVLFSKEEILTMYFNQMPYGGTNYGIEAASRSFFNKSAKDLTLDEAATLAALLQRPSSLSPYGPNVDQLIDRRNYTLDAMVGMSFITKEQAEEAKKVTPKFAARKDSITAPHFVQFVQDWLVEYFTKELGDKQLAEQKVEEGGLTVVTTLDLDKQLIAEEILSTASEKTLKRAGASNAALVSIDPKRGEIVSMVGSVDYFQEQFGNFNVATAERQPGSSFKPVVYAAAFKEKFHPGYTIFDLETDFGKYKPQNYDGHSRGPLTIRQALGNSLNVPAVKTLALIGLDKALNTAHDMGITTLNDKNRYGLSLVLGGGEVKLVDLTTAYGVFANNGTLMPTTPILKITDSQGKEIYNHEDPKDGRQVLDPKIAYQVTSILSDTEAKKPTFSRVMGSLTLNGRPAASKTGTTNAYRDAWTLGYTPQFVTGVWAGNNDNSSMNNAGGSIAAAPIWDEYMERIHKDLPVEQFSRPQGLEEMEVARYSSLLPTSATQEKVKDLVAPWQKPTEQDSAVAKIRVCRENGLLADESIPDSLTEDRIYANIHSEKPNDPQWEGPVQAWARANGFVNTPPTGKCQVDGSEPTVKITSPSNGSGVGGVFTVVASASAPSGVRAVDFSIDGSVFFTATESPYQASYNAANLTSGTHTINVLMTSNNGSTRSDQITVTVSNDTTAPGEVTNYGGSQSGLPSGSVKLTWINPGDADLKAVKIYTYRNGVTLERTNEVGVPTQTLTLTGLTPGIYNFVAKTLDNSGNESAGVTIILNIV
ncbi:MAG: PBP1A family penicillin-binding protein [Candidatus Berkelbacteria bacterium]|nr:MAG: PBP1A family penicillin-binding protein [Candidatus Berkelbacteria bacterium]QQG51482.1 MAG: PBP1A family penicillin-binding protein [Candidatus Berkelbacteria bacterium]